MTSLRGRLPPAERERVAMTVWVVFYWDVTAIVEGIYASELEARRAAEDGWHHVAEVTLPCKDFFEAVKTK